MTGQRLRTSAGVVGELLITAGAVVALFAVYTLFWTGVQTAQAQADLERALLRQPQSGAERPDAAVRDAEPSAPAQRLPGDPYAQLRIPALGESWAWVVVEGVDPDVLRDGPGHYPGSAHPGEIGNVAVAGHRATYGEPFAQLDSLRPGDAILLHFGGRQYRYLVTESYVTQPSDVAVVAAVPGRPGVEPTQAMITLTTCHPRWSSEQRLVVHGLLERSPSGSTQGRDG